MIQLYEKRPADRLDYDIDFGTRWLPSGDTIANAVATLSTTSGGTAAIDGITWSTTVVKVWVKSGIDGELAEIEVTITTAQGRTKKQCFKVRIRDC